MMHQERLDRLPTGAQTLSSPARALWPLLVEVCARLHNARLEYFREILAHGCDADAMLVAALRGRMLVHIAGGVAASASAQEQYDGLRRNWLGLQQVVAECTPRDATIPRAFMLLGRRLFRAGSEPAVQRTRAVDVFAQMALCSEQHSAGNPQSTLTWAGVCAQVDKRVLDDHASSVLSVTSPAVAATAAVAAAAAQQTSTSRKAAAREARAAAKALADTAASGAATAAAEATRLAAAAATAQQAAAAAQQRATAAKAAAATPPATAQGGKPI